jgi:phospholipid/cholesterol/gamma-HCH transport system substrate-binding protein
MQSHATQYLRFPGLKRQVIIYVALALLGFAAMVLLIAYKQGFLEKRTGIWLSTPDASGISIGMPVKLMGFRVGKVDRMSFKYPSIQVELAINSDLIYSIPKDSKVRFARESLIGTTYLEIVPGDPTAGPIAENTVLEYDRSMSLSELANYFEREVQPIIKNLQKTTQWMVNPEGDFIGSFREMHKMVKDLQQTQRRMDRLLDDMTTTSNAMRKASEDMSAMAQNVDKTITTEVPRLRKSTEFTLEEANTTLRHYRQLGTKADKTVDAVQPVVDEASEITSGLKRSWPLKGILGTPKTQTAPSWQDDLPLPSPPAAGQPKAKARGRP